MAGRHFLGIAVAVVVLTPSLATAAAPPALVRCVTAWNARGETALRAYAAPGARRVRLQALPGSSTNVGGVRSVQGRRSVVQACVLTIFRPQQRITTVSGLWINGGVRTWKTASGTLSAGPVRNARLLPDGRLALT